MALAHTPDIDAVARKYMALDQGGKIQAEYVWIGGSGQDLRCKTRVWLMLAWCKCGWMGWSLFCTWLFVAWVLTPFKDS